MRSLDIECVLCACGTRERVVQGLRLCLGSGFKTSMKMVDIKGDP